MFDARTSAMQDVARRELARLPARARALQSVRVAKAQLERFPDDWEGELRGAVAAWPAVSPGHKPLSREQALVAAGQPLSLSGQSGFAIDHGPAGGLCITACRDFTISGFEPGAPADRHRKHFVHITECQNFTLDGLALKEGRTGIFLHRCRNFQITNVTLSDLDGYGIILFDCSSFRIEGVRAERCLGSALLCVGAIRSGLIRNLTALRGRGILNQDAGLHFSHCTPEIEAEDVPERCHEARSILDKEKRPSFILVEDIRIEDHRAQGIYLEGAVACVFRRAKLLRNNKEGICFDWGTVLCSLEDSEICGNGERARLTREEVAVDFIQGHPMLQDGSSSCKLPGVSLDNAAFNRVRGCRIASNFGGAVKAVRGSSANQVIGNYIEGNARGDNRFHRTTWFHNADLLDVNREFAGRQALLDFGPSYATRIEGNVVVGGTWGEFGRSVWRAVRHRIWSRHIASRLRPATLARIGVLKSFWRTRQPTP